MSETGYIPNIEKVSAESSFSMFPFWPNLIGINIRKKRVLDSKKNRTSPQDWFESFSLDINVAQSELGI